jgi:gluconolactonase
LKTLTIGTLGAGLIFSAAAFSQQAAEPPARDGVAPNIPGIVAGGTKIQLIQTGFKGTEGPVALPDGGAAFSELDGNRIVKIDKDGKVSTFTEPSGGSNGIGFDSKGRLIATQTMQGKTGIAVIYPKGSETFLASDYQGTPFVRPNDLVIDKKGGVYFTDPDPQRIFYVPAGGKAVLAADGKKDGITRPNGIQLSPDERTLYVNDIRGEYLIAYDVQPNGTLRNKRNFAKYVGVEKRPEGGFGSGADGLAIDSAGNVYTTSNAGVDVFNPQGRHVGTIHTPQHPQNLAFAGADKKTLYLVGRGSAYKMQMLVQGYTGRAK